MRREHQSGSRHTSPSSIKSLDQVKVGDKLIVRGVFRDKEERCEAIVIEIKRPSQQQKLSNGDDPGNDIEETSKASPAHETLLFYVHYVGMDRRLDEWVDEGRVVFGDGLEEVAPTLTPLSAADGKLLTRSQRRIQEEFHHVQKSYEDMDATTAKLEREHEERTKVKNIELVEVGEYEINAWYFSPFPPCLTQNATKLFFCKNCLWYTADERRYGCHLTHNPCAARHPPGELVYRDEHRGVFIYEVEGARQRGYCQSLCLLSKLFLDHKTLYYDVDGFLFYVLCERPPGAAPATGEHIVGHFSKELNSANNLACIMVLPPFQRKGYGKLLIQMSYCLSELEGVVGTPEKPLSDLGKVSYRSYWWWVLIKELDKLSLEMSHISVRQLSHLAGIHVDDITSILNTLQLIKYWKGDHVVRVSRKIVEQIKEMNIYHPPKLLLNRQALLWSPRKKSSTASGAGGNFGNNYGNRRMTTE